MKVIQSKRGITIQISQKDLEEAMRLRYEEYIIPRLHIETSCKHYDQQQVLLLTYEGKVIAKYDPEYNVSASEQFGIPWGTVLYNGMAEKERLE
jgi:hypothetical protein